MTVGYAKGSGRLTGEWYQRTETWLRSGAGVLACGLLGAWVMRMVGRMRYPYELSYGEADLLYHALRIGHGGPMYSPTHVLPYVPNVYGPMFPLLWAPFAAYAGPVFWPGRLLGAITSVAVALCICWLVVRETRDRLAAVIALGVWASANPTYLWSGLARVDMLALALALTGFGLATSPNRHWRWFSVVLFAAAAYTKQSMLAAPFAAYTWMASRGEGRAALGYFAAWAGVCLVVLGGLSVETAGGAWQEMIGGAVMHPWSLANLLGALRTLVAGDMVLSCLAVVLTALAATHEEARGYALYALSALIVAMAVGKSGAALNYFLEPIALTAVLCGLGVARKRGLLTGARTWRLALMGLIVLQFLPRMWTLSPGAWYPGADSAENRALIAAISRAPEPVLSEHMGAALQAHKTVWIEPFANTHLAQRGLWDQSQLVQMIEQRAFSLIVVGPTWSYYVRNHVTLPPDGRGGADAMFTSEQLAAMARFYRPQGTIGRYTLLVPR